MDFFQKGRKLWNKASGGRISMAQQKNLRKLQLIQEFLEKKSSQGKVDINNSCPSYKEPTKEELDSNQCFFDYSSPKFKGDMRFSCQHKTRSGELQHRELIVVIPDSKLLSTLGRNNQLRGRALGEYYANNQTTL